MPAKKKQKNISSHSTFVKHIEPFVMSLLAKWHVHVDINYALWATGSSCCR